MASPFESGQIAEVCEGYPHVLLCVKLVEGFEPTLKYTQSWSPGYYLAAVELKIGAG